MHKHLIRRFVLIGVALLVPLGAGAFAVTTAVTSGGSAAAAAPKYNDTTDTVHCSTFYGKVTISPALSLTGTSPTTIAVSGDLLGCSDATGFVSGSKTSDTEFTAKVSGTLSGATNSISTLSGCSSATGTLTVKWSAYYYNSSNTPAEESLTNSTTVASISQIYGALFSPGAPCGSSNVTTDGYGSFQIGANASTQGCTAPTYTSPGAFLGSDLGASTASVAVTSEDGGAIISGQTGATVTKLLLGIGAYYGG
jgi:hypothetical protein